MLINRRTVQGEHLGFARHYVNQLLKTREAQFEAIFELVAPIRKRLFRRDNIRPEHYVSLVREWKDKRLNDARLKFETSYDKKKFHISEYFVSAIEQSHEKWNGSESAVGIWHIAVRNAKEGEDFFTLKLVSTISLHALARWLERGSDNSLAAFHADALSLTNIDDPMTRRARTPDGGYWCGGFDLVETTFEKRSGLFDNPVFNARTYLSAPMIGLRDMGGDD